MDGAVKGAKSCNLRPDAKFREADGLVRAVGVREFYDALASGTGRSHSTDSAWLWTVVNGKITQVTAYHDSGAMQRAFGG